MDPVNIMPSTLPLDVAIFIEVITPVLYLLVLTGIWLGITIPLLVVLFVASDAPLRQKPIFIFNVISVVMGIIIGLTYVISLMRGLQGAVDSRKLIMATTVMVLAVEFLIDGILLFRVYSVFPLRTTRRAIWFSILIPIALLKIARLSNIIVFIVKFAKGIDKISYRNFAAIVYTLPETKIGWVLQLVDNATCSVIFIWKLKTGLRASTSSTVVTDSYAARVKGLFWIAISNFVFPALFDIVLIVISTSVSIQEKATLIMGIHQSNIYVEIIGVLFATVWTANARANISRSSAGSHTSINTVQFIPNPVLATNRSHRSSTKMTLVSVTVERTESRSSTDEMSAPRPPKSSVY